LADCVRIMRDAGEQPLFRRVFSGGMEGVIDE
jgi:hypothetical protein